ncbi:MAG TPA: DASH family cryptochrome [Anditalea sp.]|nr:DASH family cryptochrome [Anditalea sp.]
MRTSIVWFKTDLRLYDNETLYRAIEQNDRVIPVYCLDESHFQKTAFGFLKTGSFRTKFLLESLGDLDSRLRNIGSGLILLRGKPEIEIPNIALEYGAQRVYAKKEVAYEEKKTAEKVEKALWEIKCSLEVYSTSTLNHAQDLPFPINEIPDVFTNFRKQVETESQVRPVFPSPNQINSPPIPPLDLPSLEGLGLQAKEPDKRQVLNFKGGETSGLQRVEYYFFESKAVSTYKESRNGMVGEIFSTKFSPWLSLGCLSPRGVYHEIKKYEEQHGGNDSTYWLIFELMWRDYFRFMMKKYQNKFFQQNGIKKHDPNLSLHNQELLEKWINGKTGDDFIDANMLELKLTGYLSNRGRQNVASYLVNDLHIDWRYGAAYFEQQLIDYDVCSNWGNWAYQAGVGNDPRGKRKFNTEKQAEDYDPDRTYRKLWLKKK